MMSATCAVAPTPRPGPFADLSESDGNLTFYLGSPVIQDTNHVEGLLGEQFSGKLFDIDSGSGALIQVARRDVPEVSGIRNSIAAQEFGSDYTDPVDMRVGGVEATLGRVGIQVAHRCSVRTA